MYGSNCYQTFWRSRNLPDFYFRSVNDACVHYPFPTPFSDEVLAQVAGNEAYSFTDGFLQQGSFLIKQGSSINRAIIFQGY